MLDRRPRVVMHNALHDLPILDELGVPIEAEQVDDTMLMSFCLGTLPLGLKPLSRRLLGAQQNSFEETIRPAERRLSLEYIKQALTKNECPRCHGTGKQQMLRVDGKGYTKPVKCLAAGCTDGYRWPPTVPRIVWDWKSASWKSSQPWSIAKYLQRLRADIEAGKFDQTAADDAAEPEASDEDETGEASVRTVRQRWYGIDEDIREPVEAAFGPMPEATLDDIPEDAANHYSARDADLTYRIYPKLKALLKSNDLTAAYKLDLSVIPWAAEMQRNGMRINVPKMQALSKRFQREQRDIAHQLRGLTGRFINPGSGDQVADLLFGSRGLSFTEDDAREITPHFSLELSHEKRTSSGKRAATDEKVLEGLKLKYAEREDVTLIVQHILDYRTRQKLDSFAVKLASMVDNRSRVHTRLKLTTAATYRLACVAGETQLHTSRGVFRFDEYLPIEGDTVTTHRGRQRRVLRKIYKGVDTMFRVCLDVGASLKCTLDHKILTPTGWFPLRSLPIGAEVFAYEPQQKIHDGTEHHQGTENVSGFGRPDSSGDSGSLRNNFPKCDPHFEALSAIGRVQGAETAEVCRVQDRGPQPYAGQEWRPASQLDRRCERQQRPFDAQDRQTSLLRTPDCDGGGYRSAGAAASGATDSASSRSEPAEQRFGQSRVNDQGCAHATTSAIARIAAITYCGEEGVWDIEVEEDHSYLSSGFVNHNSAEPNLQNIPIRNKGGADLGRLIRECFEAPEGHCLGSADYSQVELRVLAALSGDDSLLEAFRTGLDPHVLGASRAWRIPYEEIDKGRKTNKKYKDMRDSAKNLNFGIVFGITPRGLQAQMELRGLHYTLDECADLIRMWIHETFPGIGEYIAMVHAEAKQHGYVRSFGGHIRHCPGVWSLIPAVREEALRQAVNFTIQCSAAEIMKHGIGAVWQKGKRILDDARAIMLMSVHDELLTEQPDTDEARDMVALAVETYMTDPIRLPNDVKIETDIKFAPDWGTLKAA